MNNKISPFTLLTLFIIFISACTKDIETSVTPGFEEASLEFKEFYPPE